MFLSAVMATNSVGLISPRAARAFVICMASSTMKERSRILAISLLKLKRQEMSAKFILCIQQQRLLPEAFDRTACELPTFVTFITAAEQRGVSDSFR